MPRVISTKTLTNADNIQYQEPNIQWQDCCDADKKKKKKKRHGEHKRFDRKNIYIQEKETRYKLVNQL